MKPLLTLTLVFIGSAAHAFDVEQMIADCNAPLSPAIAQVVRSDVQSSEWNNLNLVIKAHRSNCAVPMAISCHLSDAPDQCYTDLTVAIDGLAEKERLKLTTYFSDGGIGFGTMPELAANTAEARLAAREAYCNTQGSDASNYVTVLGGNGTAACRLEMAVNQWADLAFVGSAPQALSLLPP